ncbi:hypothetical protein [Sphingopyxis sp. DBS4]|jgi:hypothetical protein|uniref:hypothetical protein n=1 Tax=Sphingopyxis sp. DBS4 TaxID=2968500 RepID=UPI00214AEAB6|nr:hypothetical protein [Sphingopyxis sp. DBS4]
MKRNWGRLLCQICFVLGVTALAWFHLAASVMAVCAVVLVALSGKFESLIEVSFGPLKAKLERNISESEHLLQSLKALAVTQARATNAASVNTGRWASGDDWVYQSVMRVENGLRELGITDDEIADAKIDFVSLTIRDAASAAMGGGYVPSRLGQEAITEWQQVMRDCRSDPDAIEAYLSKWGELSPDRKIRIDDMRWMMTHRSVQDSAQYMRAHDPIKWDDGQ